MRAIVCPSLFLVLQFLCLICGTGALLWPSPPTPPSTPPSNVSIVAFPAEESYSHGTVDVVLTCNVGAGSAPFTYGWILNGGFYVQTVIILQMGIKHSLD